MSRFSLSLLALFALILSVLAAAPPSFCKCTCFSNSTIIPLSSHAATDSTLQHLALRAPAPTCNMCKKAFCLEQRLPICKGAEEKDVTTTCFQRDSRKDQIVVVTFILVTVGLLVWSAVRKVIEKRNGSNNRGGGTQQEYVAVGR